MGICDGLEGSSSADCSVGTIVWVRRRNGSWWPGRILGPNELSASHLMSPRSGTPVKLLGREDASVDWYNLEKSKRVKAFRCGEFDDCIERAESSQGIPIKKREKYARREDAILHALELEKEQLDKKQQKLGIASNSISNKISGVLRKELDSCSPSENNLGNDEPRDRFKFRNIRSQLLSKRQDISLEEDYMDNPLYAQKGKHVKQPSWEDDNAEAIPRMRGLQDFGLKIASSKKKISTSTGCGSPQKPFFSDNHLHVLPNRRSLSGANHVSSSKNSLAVKRKRSEGGLAEESLVKRRDRRRPLVQVLQSSAKLPVCQSLQSDGDAMSISVQGEKDQMGVICRAKRSRCVYLPPESNGGLDHAGFPSEQMQIMPSPFGMDNGLLHPSSLLEENTCSGLIEATESDSSESDYLDPDMEEDTAALSDTTQVRTVPIPGSRDSEKYVGCTSSVFQIQGQPGNMSNEELDESGLSGYMSELHTHEQTASIVADMGSKWQSKGRRNIRNLNKRQMEVMEGNDPITTTDTCNGSVHGTFYEGQGSTTRMEGMKISGQRALKQGFYHRSEGLNYAYDKVDFIEKDLRPSQMVEYENRRYPLMLKAASEDGGRSDENSATDSDEDSHSMSPLAWEADELSSQAALRGYWDEPDEGFDPIYVGHRGNSMEESMLVDVDLKVQTIYQGEHVPLVSLMSRLNGKAIIGHPIQIETLEDGSSDLLLSTNDLYEEPADNDGNTAVQPVWRTARRTAMHRVPRPRPSSALEGHEADLRRYSDVKCKPPPYKKPLAGPSDHKARLMRKNFSHIPRKPPKKVSLSSQKTRTLSSIAIEQKPEGGKDSEPKISTKIPNLDGAITIKPEEAALSSVTCIPLKLVFSRILEGVGRPPSKVVGPNGVSVLSDAERKPS